MSQISPPIRILLVGAIVFLAAWFTVLKPKPVEDVPPATAVPAGATAPGAAASKPGEFKATAESGAAKAEASAVGAANAGIEEDGTAATAPGTTTPTQTGVGTQAAQSAVPSLPALAPEALKGLPKPLRTGLEERKVVVLGVLNTEATAYAQMADDDRAVRSVLRDVNRYGGGVVVRTAPITRLAKYDVLLKALQVTQSPTVVVVDRNRRAVALEGYVDRGTVNQAIADARDTSVATRIKDPYLREVNEWCGRQNLLTSRSSVHPTVRGGSRRLAATHLAKVQRQRSRFVRLATPARWRGFDGQMIRLLDSAVAGSRRVLAASRAGGLRSAVSASRRSDRALAPQLTALDRRFNAEGLTACAARRTR